MKYRLLSIYLFICLVLINLSSCSPNPASPVELLAKPKLNLDQQFVIELIMSIIPHDSYIARPMKSKTLSSVGFVDINHDGGMEIYSFYVDKNTKNVGLILVHQEDNEWKLLSNIKLMGSDIAYADFVDCDGDEISEFIIGTLSDEQVHKNLYILKIRDLSLEVVYKDFYTEVIIDDFDSDKIDDIAMFKLDRNNFSYAEILKFEAQEVKIASKTELDPYISGYYNIRYGNINRSQKAFVLDFETGSKSATNILLYEKNHLIKVFDSFELDPEYKKTLKLSPIRSQDIDGDGLIEIANNFRINLTSGKPKNPSGLIVWNNYYDDVLNIKKMFFLGDRNHLKIEIPNLYMTHILHNSLELVDYNMNGKDYQLDFYVDTENKNSKWISLKKLKEEEFQAYVKDNPQNSYEQQPKPDNEILMNIRHLGRTDFLNQSVSEERIFEMIKSRIPNIKAYYKELGILELDIKNAKKEVFFIKFYDLDYREKFYSAHSLLYYIARDDYRDLHDVILKDLLLQFDDLIKNIDFI